jgi:large subunit ribosomal protein L29
MKIKEIRELSPAEMLKRRRELREESFQLRLQQKSGQLENTARLRQIRREVARMETILDQKRASAAPAAKAQANA